MADCDGDRTPYLTARLIYSLAVDPSVQPYVEGKLMLAGVDSRVPAAGWFAAVYAIVVDAPTELLEKLHAQIVMTSTRIRPDRETWGVTPEQQAMMKRAERAGGG